MSLSHRFVATPAAVQRTALGACSPLAWGAALALALPSAQAATPPPVAAWQHCASTTDNAARLACFDAWAQHQQPSAAPPATGWQAPAASAQAHEWANAGTGLNATGAPTAADANGQGLQPTNGGCRDPRYSEVSRFYELEPGSDCGTFSFRGYRPLSVAITTSDKVNRQPTSPSKPTASYQPYSRTEMRIQLSARTKIAQGLLTGPNSRGKDSLWVAYSQQSYWQVFNGELSRPFRTTDHEPEIFYVYPTDFQLPLGWRWRYSGVGLVHHSNGQSEPLSRSWNRWYLFTGGELDQRWQLHAKLWSRVKESSGNDDNPTLQDYWGRGEVRLGWNVNSANHVGLTVRGAVQHGKGSARLEWLRTLGEGWNGGKSNLRLHVQLFSGYGESLIDYNFKRTSLSVGLSLLDF